MKQGKKNLTTNVVYGTEKECKKCYRVLDLSFFYVRKDSKSGYRSHCKECVNKSNSDRAKKDKYSHNRRKLKYLCKHEYKITLEEYDEYMRASSCGICNTTEGRFALDHCHITGKIRGKLCSTCNTGIGMLKDSPELLRKAIKWIEQE